MDIPFDDDKLEKFIGVKVSQATLEAIQRRCNGKLTKSRFIRKVVEDYLRRAEIPQAGAEIPQESAERLQGGAE